MDPAGGGPVAAGGSGGSAPQAVAANWTGVEMCPDCPKWTADQASAGTPRGVRCPPGLAATGILLADPGLQAAAREMWDRFPTPAAGGQRVRRRRSVVDPRRMGDCVGGPGRGHSTFTQPRAWTACRQSPVPGFALGCRRCRGSGAPRDRLRAQLCRGKRVGRRPWRGYGRGARSGAELGLVAPHGHLSAAVAAHLESPGGGMSPVGDAIGPPTQLPWRRA